jgi:hypothetical protein
VMRVVSELSGFAALTAAAGPQDRFRIISNLSKIAFLSHRRLALSKMASCHVPAEVELDGQTVIVRSCPLPILLRRAEENTYQLVGTCYVHGMMDGQGLPQSTRAASARYLRSTGGTRAEGDVII